MRPHARATLLQHRCNVFAVDGGLRWARNGSMIEGADMPGSSSAVRARCRPADPCHATENGETPENPEIGEALKTAKTRKSRKSIRVLSHAPTAPAAETLKHETVLASRSTTETVKQAPAHPTNTAVRTACETVKHRRKSALNQGLGCFTPGSPAGLPGAMSCRNVAVGETLKHPVAASPGIAARRVHETVKRLITHGRPRAVTAFLTPSCHPCGDVDLAVRVTGDYLAKLCCGAANPDESRP